ncbi:hypothetical protein CEXT_129031 [Caerostris extrusa]|uniref:Uncharacterized protein n=1 Tax=Caerostris extrusa TaxID=172846 RepID=A0AAV4Y1R9_CAEEX|nr:hypothetical protein CEXT_129031 [Caerostris extrusa]
MDMVKISLTIEQIIIVNSNNNCYIDSYRNVEILDDSSLIKFKRAGMRVSKPTNLSIKDSTTARREARFHFDQIVRHKGDDNGETEDDDSHHSKGDH